MDTSNVKIGDFILIDHDNYEVIICIVTGIHGKKLIVENLFDMNPESFMIDKWSYLDYYKQMKLTEMIEKNPKFSKYKRILRKQKIEDILKDED